MPNLIINIAVVVLCGIPAALILYTLFGKPEKKETAPPVPKLPPAIEICDVCQRKMTAVNRCSVCKNSFYCSQECQTKDWPIHKFKCSMLPGDGLTAAKIRDQEELHEEVERLSNIFKEWKEAEELFNKEGNDAFGGAYIPEGLKIAEIRPSQLWPYSRVPSQHKQYPYRLPIIHTSRLFLMDLVARLQFNKRALARLEAALESVEFPPQFARLYGPKLISKPAELSPGEYEALCFAFVAASYTDNLGMTDKDQWDSLMVGLKKLWNAPPPPVAKS
jgi:hypothetical protein